MNSNIVQMLSRPPINPNRGKNNQASYTNIPQQQINNVVRQGANVRDHQSKSFVEPNQFNQQLKNPMMRVNSDKKMPNSRTTHSQFSFHLNQNQNLNTEAGMQNGSWSSGHNTGQFGAGSHTNSVGRQSSNANQTPYTKNEQQYLLNQVRSPVMAQQYNTIPYNSEGPSSLEDNEAQILAGNWNSIHNRQPQSVTAQLKNIIGDRQAKLLKGKQSSSLNRQMAGFKGMDDGNAQRRNTAGYAAQHKPKAGRFISGNSRKPQAQLNPSVHMDAAAKQMNQKKSVGRVISHDGRAQKQGEQPPINIYAQLMEPSQPSQENEILVHMMQNKALNASGDSSLNDIMNYPPEQLKTLLELRGGKHFAEMYEDAMTNSNNLGPLSSDYASANSANYNMPLQIKSQNYMMNMQGDAGKYANQATILNQQKPQNLKAMQKELLNQYYRQKHQEESHLKEKEQQILGIIQSIQQEQEMRSSNLSSFAQQTFQPGPMVTNGKDQGLSFGLLPLEQQILFQDQGVDRDQLDPQYQKDEQMKSLQTLYAKMNEDYHENKHQLKTRMDQMNRVIAEANKEVSSEDSDKKAENLINFLKQEVEELKQQNGMANQMSLKTLKKAQNDAELAELIKNTEDHKHEQGVLQQHAAPKSWLRPSQPTTEVATQQIQQERHLQIFDVSQKNSANNRDRNTHRSKNELNQEDGGKSKSLKTQDSAAVILQQQFSKTARKSLEAKQNQQLPPPTEIMINTDYDNDQAMLQKERDGQALPTEKSVDEQHGLRKVRNKSNVSSKKDHSQGSGSQRSASYTYRPASSNLATMGQHAQNSHLMAPELSVTMPEEFASNENLHMPYSEGQSFVPKRKDVLMTNASNRFKRKNDNSAEASSKDLSKDNSSSSLRLKSNQIDAKQFSGLTFNNNSRVEDENAKDLQDKAGEGQSNDTLAQYLIGGQLTPNQNLEAKDGMTPDSVESLSQNNRSHQELLKLLHNQNKSYKSSERNEMVSKTADAVMRNRVQRQESHQVGQENDQFTNLNINNNRSDIEKNSNQGQRIFQSSPLSSKKQLGDDSEQFNERLAALVANTDAQGRFSHELSYSRLNAKNEDNEFVIESSQHDNTLQLSGELMPQHIDRLVSQQQQSERNLLDSQEQASMNEQIQERKLRSGGPFNRQIGANSNEVHLNGFENHILQQFKDDSVKNLSVILNNEQQQQMQMPAHPPLQERVPLRSDQLQRNLQAQQKNINQLNLPQPHQDDDANNLFPTNIQSTQRQDASAIHATLNPDNTAINILQAENQQPAPAVPTQQTENIFKLLLEDHRFLNLINKAPTHDQNVQTDLQKIHELAAEAECQTDQQFDAQQRNLSPFETYDLIFIRDLVNNLNYDNEVLHDNAQDLKAAFMFLHHEHKQLQFKYQKEQRNAKLVELYRERAQELMKERNTAMEKAMELRKKNELMNDVMKLAVEQSQLQEAETDRLLEQLAEENKQLRMMLGIHREQNDPSIIELGVKELTKLEKEQANRKAESLNKMEEEHDAVEQEIHEGLLTYEQQMQRTQDDYLMILREEHDMQFNQDIDEHKEILQRIYDEKLSEKTEEMEHEIHAVLSKELTLSISKDLKEKMADQMRREVRAEVKVEVRDEVVEGVKKEEQQKAAEQLTEEITAMVRAQLQEQLRAEMEQEYEQKMKEELAKRQADAGDPITEQAETAADARNELEQLKLLKQGSSLDSNERTKNLLDYQQILNMEQQLSTPRDQEDFKDTQGVFTGNELFGDPDESSDNENDRTQKLYQEPDDRQERDGDEGADAYVTSLSSSLPLPRTSNSAQKGPAEGLENALAESPQRMPNGTDQSSSENWSESDGAKRSDSQGGDAKGQGAGGAANKYNFDNIVFESQHMSAEEQELFNQLQQRENLGQNNERVEEHNLGSSLAQADIQEEQAMPQLEPERPPLEAARSNTQPAAESTGGDTQQRRNHHQSQGFQGQVLNRNINQYPNQAQSNGFESSPGQGLSRGSQIEGNNNVAISPNRQNRPPQQRQSQSSNFGRAQGFQGQTISGGGDVLAEQMPQPQTSSTSPRPVLLSNVPFELQQINRSPINQASETIDHEFKEDYKEFIESLQENKQPKRAQLSADKTQSQTLGSSPSTANATSQSDPFGDQLEKEMQKKDAPGQQRAINFSPSDQQPINFLEDEVFQSDKSISPIKSAISPPQDAKRRQEGASALDRTDGLRSMLIAMDEENSGSRPAGAKENSLDREEEKEEEYDYFLDPVKDEGGFNNKGYHLVDAADLEAEQKSKAKDDDLVDPDEEEDLDKIQDNELRQYRYNNMLEDLKESIQQEEQDQKEQQNKNKQ